MRFPTTVRQSVKRQRLPEDKGEGPQGAKAVETSKESFLNILRRGNAIVPPSRPADESRASFLRDDYLVGKKQRVKDFEADLAEDEEDVDDGQDADEEADIDDEF